MLLTGNQQRFRELLSNSPELEKYWCFEDGMFKEVEARLDASSRTVHQNMMLEFFSGVWHGTNHAKFDLFTAMSILPSKDKATIMIWVEEPFYPESVALG